MTEWYESDELRPPALSGVLREALKELHWPRPELDDSGVWLCEHAGAVVGFAVFRSIPNYAAGGAEDDWELTHVWLRRDLRGRGILRAVWPRWRELYGDFALVEPNPGMESAARALDS